MSELLFALAQVKNVIVGNCDEGEITDMYIQLHDVMSEDTHLTDSQSHLLNFIKSENVRLRMWNESDYQVNVFK